MNVSILTILGAILFICIKFFKKEKVEWANFVTTVSAIHTFLSMSEIMIRFFNGESVSQSELMKPITIGFVIILFSAYQNLVKNIQNEKKDSTS